MPSNRAVAVGSYCTTCSTVSCIHVVFFPTK